MTPILVDTSVWIDWFTEKKVITEQTSLLETYFTQQISVYITPVILQEVLQGIRMDKDYTATKDVLFTMSILRLDAVEAAVEAAQLYRNLRKKGVTIRKPNDCLIAYYALFYDLPILHNDIDFEQIARHTALRVATS